MIAFIQFESSVVVTELQLFEYCTGPFKLSVSCQGKGLPQGLGRARLPWPCHLEGQSNTEQSVLRITQASCLIVSGCACSHAAPSVENGDL